MAFQRKIVNFLLVNVFIVLPLLCVKCISASNVVRFFNFEDECPQDRSKNVINIKNGAAVFRLDESRPKMRNLLKNDFNCHIEVETLFGHFLHVYIQEMDILSDSSSIQPGRLTKCKDFLQFGRDILIFTTHKSQEFCGKISPINYGPEVSTTELNEQLAISSQQGTRLYIEDKDHELDLWLKLTKTDYSKSRSLTIVVTSFKPSCAYNDPMYRLCNHTRSCIRRDLFCDGWVNCAWPSGDLSSDEINCDKYLRRKTEELSTASDNQLLSIASLPITIMAFAAICLLCLAAYISYLRITKARRLSRQYFAPPAPSSLPECNNLMDRRQSCFEQPPPSYEESIQYPRTTDPPPYTPSAPPYSPSAPPL